MAEVLVISTTLPEDLNFNDDLTNALDEFGFESDVIPYLKVPKELKRIKASHGVIVAGVPFHYPSESAEELQPYLKLWLPEVEVPVLGICLGHQAMGLVFGATMRRYTELEEGTCTAEIIDGHQDDPIFKDMGRQIEVASFHWASISIEEAPRLIRLARSLPKPGISTGCENQVVRVTDKPCYGAQFHPEKSEVGKLFLRNFLELPRNRPN